MAKVETNKAKQAYRTNTAYQQATNVTRRPYFADNKSDPSIASDVIDSSITQRTDIRTATKRLRVTVAFETPVVLR